MKPDFFNCFSGYEVRRLTEDDLNEMYALCAGNPLYYEHFGSPLTLEGLRNYDIVTHLDKNQFTDLYAGRYFYEHKDSLMRLGIERFGEKKDIEFFWKFE